MKTLGRWLPAVVVGTCAALLLGACSGSDDHADAKAFCSDYRVLVNSGSQVLSDRSHWDPLLDRAAAVNYEPLRNAALAVKTELVRIDRAIDADPEQTGLEQARGLLNQPCVDVGVSPFLGRP